MFILKNQYLKLSLLATAAAILLAGCSDDKEDDNGTTPPVVKDILSVDRPSLVFDADDVNRPEIKVTKSAEFYEATCPETWVTIIPANDSFRVSVEPYTEQEAALADYEPREATITVTSGNAREQTVKITQYSPLETRFYIKTDPSDIYFEVGEYTALVRIQTNVPNVTFTVPEQFEWLSDVDLTADVIAVTVPQYIGDDLREGYVILHSPDTDLHYKLWVVQENEIVIDLEGTWNWTGLQWYGGNYNQQEGTVDINYNEDYDFYYIEPFGEYLTGMDFPDGGMAIRLNPDNTVTFANTDKLYKYEFVSFLGIFDYWYSYRNMVTYATLSDGERITAPKDVVYDLEVGNTTIKFPPTDMPDQTEYHLLFGFGGYVYDPDYEIEDTSGNLEGFGLWRDLVFTKSE